MSLRRISSTLLVVAALLSVGLSSVWGANGRVTGVYTLRDIPLADFQNAAIPGSVDTDRAMLVGAIGSDLWHGPTDPPNQFWMITDRGPNGQVMVSGSNRRTFPVPGFDPAILRVRTANGQIIIQEVIPLAGQSGAPVTGLSNIRGFDETPYDYAARVELPLNPNGLDTEGLVRTSSGEFWLCDEYSPSIVHVSPKGEVLKRYIPVGVALTGTDYPVVAVLPEIYGKRKGNRGFEAVAISADERTLYVALQSPLLNPDTATGNASRNTRIIAFDIPSERVTAEYVYQFDVATEFEQGAKPDDMKISGLAWLNPTTLLVLERTDNTAKLYTTGLAATNILGSAWNEPATRPTLESLADPAASGVTVMPKSLLIDLTPLPGMPKKIEGVTIVDARTIAVANDNDSDIGDFDDEGNNKGAGVKSRILTVELDTPLPLQP